MMRDIEFTVVHELIHLEIAPVLADLQRTDARDPHWQGGCSPSR
jgi:hypothetical protein